VKIDCVTRPLQTTSFDCESGVTSLSGTEAQGALRYGCATLRSPARSGTSFHQFDLSKPAFIPSRTLIFHMLAVSSEGSTFERISLLK
jgi:hypothetical protein